MRRLLPLLAFAVAAAVAAAAAWLLLRGEPAPAPGPVPPVEAPAPRGSTPEPPPVFAPEEPAPEEPPEEGAEVKEAPLPPDAYPWEVPGWWHEVDRRLREREIAIDDEVMPVKELLDRIAKEALFPVRAGPELERWAEEFR